MGEEKKESLLTKLFKGKKSSGCCDMEIVEAGEETEKEEELSKEEK